MNRTLAKIVSLPGTVIHSLVIPLFAFLFTLYNQPRMEYDILSMQHSSYAFNVTILFCIVLGSVLLSRFSLYALGRFRSILGKYYIHSLMSDYQTWFLVIFIKCEDNYVQIHYLDRNKTKKFILRSVHRDEAGLLVAELELDGLESIPISRKYQDEITKLL